MKRYALKVLVPALLMMLLASGCAAAVQGDKLVALRQSDWPTPTPAQPTPVPSPFPMITLAPDEMSDPAQPVPTPNGIPARWTPARLRPAVRQQPIRHLLGWTARSRSLTPTSDRDRGLTTRLPDHWRKAPRLPRWPATRRRTGC